MAADRKTTSEQEVRSMSIVVTRFARCVQQKSLANGLTYDLDVSVDGAGLVKDVVLKGPDSSKLAPCVSQIEGALFVSDRVSQLHLPILLSTAEHCTTARYRVPESDAGTPSDQNRAQQP
jgi:hypothetical protein